MRNTDFKKAIDSLQSNPIACGSLCLRALEELSEGKVKIIDPSNPFVYLMETSVVLYTNALDRCSNKLNRLYPSNAKSYQDLYRHMSDKDYNNRFSSPGKIPLMFFLELEELKAKAVPLQDGSGDKKLTISRNSQVIASGVKLTFLYPVDIYITPFGTITVKYDVTSKNPLQVISDTVIPHEIRGNGRSNYLYFQIPVQQLEINSSIFSVTGSQGLKRSIKFNDKFHFLRAFQRNDGESTWTELTVKHNPLVIDNTKVTVCANVDTIRNTLDLQIPQVYKNTGLLKDNIRVDVYTTQGEINVPLFNIGSSLFKASWRDHEVTTPTRYAAPMGTFNNYKIASDGTVTGGANGLTFDALRTKVINRSIVTEGYPISFNQLANALENHGFNTILTKDNVTDREFLATKLINPPTDFGLDTTAIGSLTITHSTSFSKMVENTKSTRVNENQITVLPNAVYELVDGSLEAVTDVEVDSLLLQRTGAIDVLVNNLNSRKLYYSPYFMVHHFANDRYIVKPYRLDKPRVLAKSIENENSRIGYSCNIFALNLELEKTLTGYILSVQLNPSENLRELPFEDLKIQMRISDENDRYYYWFNGNFSGIVDNDTGRPVDELYVYKFDLPTNWAITENEEILIGSYKIPFKLNGNVDIYTIVRKAGLNSQFRTDMDNAINPSLFNDWTITNSSDYYAITHERMNISLGHHLKHLWKQQRPALELTRYRTYEEDVLAYWEEDTYQPDEFGNPSFYLDGNGDIKFVVEHAKGSPKYEANGSQIIAHKQGDVVLDAKGRPIPLDGPNGIIRQYDIVLLDAKYYFSNHEKTIEYRESVKDDIDGWMDIMEIQAEELLERTTLYTHPRKTEGSVKVLLDGGIERYIDSTQTLNITYTVDERIASNIDVKDQIRKSTVSTVQTILSTYPVISESDIVKGLKDTLKEWIIGVNVTGFLENRYNTVSVLDSSISLSIPKRLAITSNLELTVENDINITFVTHSVLTV